MKKPDSKGADRPFASKNHHLRSRLRVQVLGLDQGRQQAEIAGALGLDELPKTPSAKVQKHLLRREAVTADTWDRTAEGRRVRREALGA